MQARVHWCTEDEERIWYALRDGSTMTYFIHEGVYEPSNTDPVFENSGYPDMKFAAGAYVFPRQFVGGSQRLGEFIADLEIPNEIIRRIDQACDAAHRGGDETRASFYETMREAHVHLERALVMPLKRTSPLMKERGMPSLVSLA